MEVSKGPWNFTTCYAYAFPGAHFICTKNSVQRNKLGRAVILFFFLKSNFNLPYEKCDLKTLVDIIIQGLQFF